MGPLLLLGAGSGTASGPTYRVQDTFTGGNGTALTSHTPEVGGPWHAGIGTFQLQGNSAQPNSDLDGDQANIDAGVGDFTLACDVNLNYTDIDNWQGAGLLFRWSDVANFFLVLPEIVAGTPDGPALFLYDVQAGDYTQRGSAAVVMNSGDPHTLKVVAVGSNIGVYFDGVLLFSYTSNFNQTATQVGLYLGAPGTESAPRWDNFTVS